MQFEDKFDGIAVLKITSAYPAGALQKLQNSGIFIYNVTALDAFTVEFSAKRRDIPMICKICEKSGDRVDIEGLTGYIFYILSLLKRPVFLLGAVVWLILALWLPTRVLFVEVAGNSSLPSAYIIEHAADCGIRMGATGKDVRSEQVKNALLSKIPNLHWAGVNTSGCIATISVREKTYDSKATPKVSVTDIVATQDAIIKDITVHSGTALCQPGQAVKKGQPLISCYRDNGQILEFTGALGEVYGETKRNITSVTPMQVYKRTQIEEKKTNFYIIIGKNTINFRKDSGILDSTCVKMYTIKECKLPGGFTLPILFVTEHITRYTVEPVMLADLDCAWLAEYTQDYLANDLIAGNIISAHTIAQQQEDMYCILGTYDCREMIADFEHKGTAQNDGEDS